MYLCPKPFFHYKCLLFLLCENNSKSSNFQVASNHKQINQHTCWFLIYMLHKCGFTLSSYVSAWCFVKPLLSTAPPGGTKLTLINEIPSSRTHIFRVLGFHIPELKTKDQKLAALQLQQLSRLIGTLPS